MARVEDLVVASVWSEHLVDAEGPVKRCSTVEGVDGVERSAVRAIEHEPTGLAAGGLGRRATSDWSKWLVGE